MAGEIRIDWAEGFRVFSQSVNTLRGNLTVIGEAHAPIRPVAAHPDADVSVEWGEVSGADEQKIGDFATFTTAADRGLAGLAFVSDWMGVNFPATDAHAGRGLAGLAGLAGLVEKATAEIPPPREGLPSTDPMFLSPVDPEA